MKNPPPATTGPHAGFSLLELVVVMAIIALLAAMILPLFLSKIPREQIEESMALISSVNAKVTSYYNSKLAVGEPALPASNEAAGANPPESYAGVFVESITIVNGAVNVKFRPTANGKLAGKIVSWRPVVSGNNPISEWICGYKTVASSLQTGGTNATNVTRDAVPLRCL
ncbi:MAG: prepilin-type N-terminal cleavage/methylation domain-containing protein [Betaproteobacteria bacterium]